MTLNHKGLAKRPLQHTTVAAVGCIYAEGCKQSAQMWIHLYSNVLLLGHEVVNRLNFHSRFILVPVCMKGKLMK